MESHSLCTTGKSVAVFPQARVSGVPAGEGAGVADGPRLITMPGSAGPTDFLQGGLCCFDHMIGGDA